MSSEDRENYPMGNNDAEIQRLRAQHEWLKAGMDGQLIFAPIDRSQENLRILDSGTADGYWLKDISSGLPSSTTYVGTDIAPDLFATDLPSSFSFATQSITEMWPEDWNSKFDLVHQRLVLAVCHGEAAQKAVNRLAQLAKPGGWVQLIECDHGGAYDAEESPSHPAVHRFGELVIATLGAKGQSARQGLYLKGWMEKAGLKSVEERKMKLSLGPGDVMILQNVVDHLKAANKGAAIPSINFQEQEYEELKERLNEELRTIGGQQIFHVVYGIKP